MSSGAKLLKAWMSRSTPSIRKRAWSCAPNVLIPRIQNSETSCPGSPLRCTPIKPATRPASALVMEVTEDTLNSCGSMVVTAPTTLILRCVP